MLNRLLITGAAGELGKVLRSTLAPAAKTLRLSDVHDLGEAAPNEELVQCDLGDAEAVDRLLSGVDAVIHLGGISVEAAFAPILNANIIGVFNLYQAARKHNIRRIVFASSNHVVGFYKQTDKIDVDVPMRPDTLYGVSKGFGELLSRFYYDRHGIETVCVRIGSCKQEPADRRMLATYLSYGDLTELMRRALFAPEVGHTVIYGVSDNKDVWWDNGKAAHLGYRPQDSSEPFRAKVEAQSALAPEDPLLLFQGGRFVACGPFDD